MNPSSRVLQRTAQALTRYARAWSGYEGRAGGPPRTGDLFVFLRTAAFDLQWLVLEGSAGPGGSFLVVAADADPRVGSSDVAVGPRSACGSLTIRCGYGVRLGVEAFDIDHRTGFVLSTDLERARRKRSELDQGAVRASLFQLETDAETEYRSWQEDVLAKAVAALRS